MFYEFIEYVRVFEKNVKVFFGGMDKVEIIDYYNMWDDYEKVCICFVLR